MEHLALWAAAGLSLLWFFVHLIFGGRDIAAPFRADPRQDHTIMATLWMVWHMVTVTILLMSVFFAAGVLIHPSYAVAGTALAAGYSAVGIGARFVLGTTFKVIPQGWLFVPVAALGLLGVI
ncbi:MAG: hypothetical protein AAGL89_11115 [Pseudomonadota bacterium]